MEGQQPPSSSAEAGGADQRVDPDDLGCPSRRACATGMVAASEEGTIVLRTPLWTATQPKPISALLRGFSDRTADLPSAKWLPRPRRPKRPRRRAQSPQSSSVPDRASSARRSKAPAAEA